MPIGPGGERLPYPGDPGFGQGGGGMAGLTGDPELDDALAGADEEEGPAAGGGGDPVSFLREAIDSLQAYIDAEDDDVNIGNALKFQAGIQSILAAEQKAIESATGVTPAAKVVARQRRQGGR